MAKDLDLELQDLSPDKDIFKEDETSQREHKGNNKPDHQPQPQHVLGDIERQGRRAHQQSAPPSSTLSSQPVAQSKHTTSNNHHHQQQQQRRSCQQNKDEHQQSPARHRRQQGASGASKAGAHSNQLTRAQPEGDAGEHHQATTSATRDVHLTAGHTNGSRARGPRRDEHELLAHSRGQQQSQQPATTTTTTSATRQPKSPAHRAHLLRPSGGGPLVRLETSTRFDENFDQVDARRPRVVGATRKQSTHTTQLNGSLRRARNPTNLATPSLVECKFPIYFLVFCVCILRFGFLVCPVCLVILSLS